MPDLFELENLEIPNYFNIIRNGNSLTLSLDKKGNAETFWRINFYSRVLHSLSPDVNRVWREGARLDVEIKGWTRNIRWERISNLAFEGTILNPNEFNLEEYTETLNSALNDIIVGEINNGTTNDLIFQIGRDDAWLTYRFNGRARTIAALVVLYDLQPHPRNDLELNIQKNLGFKYPLTDEEAFTIDRTYGDPSKCADELRNEGFPRDVANASMLLTRQNVQGAQQQTYQLITREQNLEARVVRTNIPRQWKLNLFQAQNYTCRICHLQYDIAELEPDHRVPVIVEADNLTVANYLQKLMTLCRFCNQQKRETCKRLPEDYDWENSPWAYPEKFEFEKILSDIHNYAIQNKISHIGVLELLSEQLED